MQITHVEAIPLFLPVTVDVLGLNKQTGLSVCLVRIETDSGETGWGMTGITEEEVVAEAVNAVVAPALKGRDPLDTERIWHDLYWLLSPRGQTGYASHAIAAVDIALWDLKGKALGQPVWRLLGGARDTVPVYATFGFSVFDREQLAEAAKLWVSQGYTRLKMTVGDGALRRRDEPRPLDEVIAEDARRVRAVRDAVGGDVGLYIDANCNLDVYHAARLARSIEDCDIAFFEEPVTQNDVGGMVELKRRTSIPLACGQNEGLAFRFRDLLVAKAVDVVQPNVAISGGYTQCAKIAGMAAAFNIPYANGGAWSYHNMHIHAGLANGWLVEHHYLAVECYRQVFDNLPEPRDGTLALPDRPGLGFDPGVDRVRDLAKRPKSQGAGKG
jgi:L-alanine-DL-glutamate epimerase-like enolase superfamily enzyme